MTTQDWKSKDTELLVAIDDCKIAALRLILAVSALLLIYLDPSEPDRHILLTNLCLKLYVVYSVAIYVIAFRKKSFSWPVFVELEAAEIALFTVLISLSTGTNRIFFFFYFFAVLVGAMRGGSAFGFGLTIISTLLFTRFRLYRSSGRNAGAVPVSARAALAVGVWLHHLVLGRRGDSVEEQTRSAQRTVAYRESPVRRGPDHCRVHGAPAGVLQHGHLRPRFSRS